MYHHSLLLGASDSLILSLFFVIEKMILFFFLSIGGCFFPGLQGE